MWCVNSLVCEYLFIQLLPHLTSPPFVAELVTHILLLTASLLALLLHLRATAKLLAIWCVHTVA